MAETWTVLSILQWTAEFFRGKGIAGGRLDAELLLAEVLQLNRVGLYLQFDRPLLPPELAAFRLLVGRRAKREPVQYILGRTEFWSLSLRVDPAVLIPRADTETLVEAALQRLPPASRVLDVGTGSGAIAIAIAHERDDVRVEAVDLSAPALAVAADNVARHALEGRVQLRCEDLAALSGGPYDLIVSNPPYIAEAELGSLMPEVGGHEPKLALAGGADGLDCYRTLAAAAPARLQPGGWLLVEGGSGQAGAIAALFAAAGLEEIFTVRDLAGIERVVGGRSPALQP